MKNLALLIPMCIPVLIFGQVILQTGFENDILPAGWSQITVADDGGWRLGNNHDLGSAIFPVKEHGHFIGTNDVCFCDHSNDLLVSPPLDLTGYANVMLMFDYNYLDFAPQSFTVEVSADGGVSWDIFQTLSFSAGGFFGYWETKYIDFSAYAGASDILLGFRYSDGGEWWSYGAALDNVKLWQPLEDDIALDSIHLSDEFAQVGSGIFIDGIAHNFGTDTIHSFDVTWNDGTDFGISSITGITISPLDTIHFSHPIPYIPASPDAYDIIVQLDDPNGNPDEWPDDNSLDTAIYGCSIKPTKAVVAEMATGTWCGWCTRGIVYMDSMYLLHPQNFIGVDVHNYDPMEEPSYDSAMYAYQNYLSFNGGAAYPAVIAEHKKYMDPQDMPTGMLPYFGKTVPASVSVTGSYDSLTREAVIRVKSTMLSNLNDIDYRLNLIITEDSVTGTGPGWEQYNAYADGLFGAMGGFELLPDPIPAEMMHYEHVARSLQDGWWGMEGTISETVHVSDTFSVEYNLTVPDEWNQDKINVIGVVFNYSSGYFINAKSIRLKDLTWTNTDTTELIVQNFTNTTKLHIYPNPASNICYVDPALSELQNIRLTIYDAQGSYIVSKDYIQVAPGATLPIQTSFLENGIYLVSVEINNIKYTNKLIIQHTGK